MASTQDRLHDVGEGAIGGKAAGLRRVAAALHALGPAESGGLAITVPPFAVLRTGLFDRFMESNDLWNPAVLDQPDRLIAHAFQQGEMPADQVGALWQFARATDTPWAVRSSSLLEDARGQPFAGIYLTKMVACHELDAAVRYQRLLEAIKLVWASTFFAQAVAYRETVGATSRDEKMAVILQPVVGSRHREHYYPTLSGVIRSVNIYPFGHAEPDDGVVNLALGLGKTIVDGAPAWQYCPRYPAAPPPVSRPGELLSLSQRRFWAVRLSPPPEPDPLVEDEHLAELELDTAAYDGELERLISHYDAANDRLRPGPGSGTEAVALTFAPLLEYESLPLNDALRRVESLCSDALEGPVEIEFAATLHDRKAATLAILQARPLVVSQVCVDLSESDVEDPRALVVSRQALGNGQWLDLRHVVYVRPDVFAPRYNPQIAAELAAVNRLLRTAGERYVLIGFGRWGSQDPWLGVPVTWGDIGNVGALVEVVREDWRVDLSQGSHFFHNLTSFNVPYLCVTPSAGSVAWQRLATQAARWDGKWVRCVTTEKPLALRVDGRKRIGVVTT